MSATLVFVQGEQRWEVQAAPGETLLELSRRCDAPVQTLCNGVGTCVQCKIRVPIEDLPKLSKPTALERDRLGNLFHLTGERMGCQVSVLEDVTVEVLDPSLPRRRRRR
ncbi:MAG: hypothetical protein KC613_22510 [Myxococcales bacterium]|nr:hypothetical protein [Myxococcales bacterium]MCB9525368.1 hypothetical protein [Myxococcales bacterium]